MKAGTVIALGGGFVLGLFGLAYYFRKEVSQGARIVLDAAKTEAFKAALLASTTKGLAYNFADQILRVAHEETINPFVLVAIGQQESRWGDALTPKGPTGTGDGGHGRGLMQLDDRTTGGELHGTIIADGRWQDPYWNIKAAVVDHLRPDIAYFAKAGLVGDQILQGALASYNHGSQERIATAIKAGRNPEDLFVGNNKTDYSTKVLALISKLSDTFEKYGGSF